MTEEIVRLIWLAARAVGTMRGHRCYTQDDVELYLRAARDALREAVELLEADEWCVYYHPAMDALIRVPRIRRGGDDD